MTEEKRATEKDLGYCAHFEEYYVVCDCGQVFSHKEWWRLSNHMITCNCGRKFVATMPKETLPLSKEERDRLGVIHGG